MAETADESRPAARSSPGVARHASAIDPKWSSSCWNRTRPTRETRASAIQYLRSTSSIGASIRPGSEKWKVEAGGEKWEVGAEVHSGDPPLTFHVPPLAHAADTPPMLDSRTGRLLASPVLFRCAAVAAALVALITALLAVASLAHAAREGSGATNFVAFYAAGAIVRQGDGAHLYDIDSQEAAERAARPAGLQRAYAFV